MHRYCMSWTRHIMQSVTIPVVTQNRASRDYQPNNTQWFIGDSSILSHAVGLAPSKDVRCYLLNVIRMMKVLQTRVAQLKIIRC